MPEPVGDRPTKAHEFIFLFSKSSDYFYDSDAIREPHAEAGYRTRGDLDVDGHPAGRNARSVWSIHTRPYPKAHFAVFPPEIPERCILAGSRPGDLVLDPFAGSGTALEVAKQLDRDFLGIELNEAYRPLIEGRIIPASEKASQRAVLRRMDAAVL